MGISFESLMEIRIPGDVESSIIGEGVTINHHLCIMRPTRSIANHLCLSIVYHYPIQPEWLLTIQLFVRWGSLVRNHRGISIVLAYRRATTTSIGRNLPHLWLASRFLGLVETKKTTVIYALLGAHRKYELFKNSVKCISNHSYPCDFHPLSLSIAGPARPAIPPADVVRPWWQVEMPPRHLRQQVVSRSGGSDLCALLSVNEYSSGT